MHLEKSIIVQLLHSIPHINVSLHFVNSTFNPNSKSYIEVSDKRDCPEIIFYILRKKKKKMYVLAGNEHLCKIIKFRYIA
jgi:hypothetical protein